MKQAQISAAARSLEERQLAQLSGMVLDIPPRVRLVLGITAVIGLGLIIMQSLVGNQPGTFRIDKIIHFCGYAMLAAVFVMALRPVLFLPVMIALLGVGFAIEYFQPLMGRERDLHDVFANTLGVAIGAVTGLLGRGVYAWLRRDLALSAVSQRRIRCRAGAVLLREGDSVHAVHIIQSGDVKLTRTVDGHEHELALLGPGDVFGLLGLIQGTPQYATAKAQTAVTLYRLSLDEVIESSGGAEHPVAAVLQASARLVRTLADRSTERGGVA